MKNKSMITITILAMFSVAAVGCSDSSKDTPAVQQAAQPAAQPEPAPAPPADLPEGMGPLPTEVPVPADNPQTEEKVELGKILYFEPALSKSGNFSCNSCHNLGTGGVDNQQFSIGHKWQRGGRNAPTVLNSAFWSAQFWDGRAPQLEDQAKGPPLNPVEMASMDETEVVARLTEAGYGPLFEKVFGANALNYDNMAKAIAAFERTLITPDAPFDLYAQGKADISEAAKRGMQKVVEVGCTSCHSGALFTNNTFQKFAYGTDEGVKSVSGKDEDDHLFRVQSWRNVALTAPYFHDGGVKTLDEAVRVMAKTQLDTELSDGDTADIVEFLKTLTGTQPQVTFPVLPRPEGHALSWSD
ncbi:cytochrome c peroxidase [Mariprofundus ferrinatatus]|uniref:Cytochrome c peroxidase n=1 Tax=Mariprofundus ferrinatatus TaxID=1921087 RepID=A0A2K8LCX2_9PROT|nr:cytochrome c peroxidase [Mariprofundus ferrinatatus]ATX82136.1 cytochrome c peroxidase [Mariprofundus ferrinatatus]